MPPTVRNRPNLGEILTRLKLIDENQVQAALDLQKETGKLFGECLLQLGFIAEDDLGWALSSQLDLPFMNVTPEMPDPDLLSRFPRDFLRRNLVLPLVESEESLSVVLSDPTDELTVARLKRLSGCHLSAAVGTPTAIRRALDALLGPPTEDDEETVTDQVAAGVMRRAASLAAPELTQLLDRALTEGASAIHLDPEEGKVRVRFRVNGHLTEGGAIPPKAMHELVENLPGWLGDPIEAAPGVRRWGEGTSGVEPAPFRVITVAGREGASVTLILEGMDYTRRKLSAPFEPEWDRLNGLLTRPRGLVAGVAPSPAERDQLLTRLLGQIDTSYRRGWVVAPEGVVIPRRLSYFAADPRPELTRAFAEMEGVDLVAGIFDGPEHVSALAEAAERDRLVVAILPGNSALGLLARLHEAGVSSVLLAEALLAVVAQRILPGPDQEGAARAIAELFFVDADVRRMLQNGGRMRGLRAAARRQGFVELSARARSLDSVDPALIDDLDRHRYLEDAA
jgi:hypothetical protein